MGLHVVKWALQVQKVIRVQQVHPALLGKLVHVVSKVFRVFKVSQVHQVIEVCADSRVYMQINEPCPAIMTKYDRKKKIRNMRYILACVCVDMYIENMST